MTAEQSPKFEPQNLFLRAFAPSRESCWQVVLESHAKAQRRKETQENLHFHTVQSPAFLSNFRFRISNSPHPTPFPRRLRRPSPLRLPLHPRAVRRSCATAMLSPLAPLRRRSRSPWPPPIASRGSRMSMAPATRPRNSMTLTIVPAPPMLSSKAAGLLDSPIPSYEFRHYGARGPGRWITIYARRDHIFLVIAGLRFDTGWTGHGVAPNGTTHSRPTTGAVERHPYSF